MGAIHRMTNSHYVSLLLAISIFLLSLCNCPSSCIKPLPTLHVSERTQIVRDFIAKRPVSPASIQYYKNLTFVALAPSLESDNKNDCILPKMLAALELGIRSIQNIGLAHNAIIDIKLIARDTFCSSVYGPIGLFEILTKYREINAVFGLPCDYVLAPIARYCGVWQIPVLTSGGNANDFNKKEESYPTLTRLKGATTKNLGHVVKAVTQHFNWSTTALIYANDDVKLKGNSLCFFCMSIVHDKLEKASVIQQGFDTSKLKGKSVETLLRKISKQARGEW